MSKVKLVAETIVEGMKGPVAKRRGIWRQNHNPAKRVKVGRGILAVYLK